MNPNLGQMVDTPTWPFSLPNLSNVAPFTETLNSYQIQVRSLVGAFQALQSLGQLTSSITAPHCSQSNTSQAFPPQWLAFTICLKCPFFPFSHGASARPSRVHTEMPHLPWHIPTSSGKPTFPSLSSLSITGPPAAPASQLFMFYEELPLLLTPCGLLPARVCTQVKYFLNAYECSMTPRSREHYTRKKRKWFQNSQSGCQLFSPGHTQALWLKHLSIPGGSWGKLGHASAKIKGLLLANEDHQVWFIVWIQVF